MLKYLIIPISGNSTSFCHYDIVETDNSLISAGDLERAILWSMKENLSIQFVYPSNPVTQEISDLIDSVEHISIVPADVKDPILLDKAEIVVLNTWSDATGYGYRQDQCYVLRTSFSDFIENIETLKVVLTKIDRINIVIKDIDNISDDKIGIYESSLLELVPTIIEEYKKSHPVQFNLLTDRLYLKEMNNCNAGNESITLAPNGKLYVCPAFYYDGYSPVGNIEDGADIKNPQLYRLTHAPICRTCDAFQCKRCIWFNRRLTREVNTPGREQCLTAHVERNVSRRLLEGIRPLCNDSVLDIDIPEIKYLDPFDKLTDYSHHEKNSGKGL